jgi:hypothetical protein
MLMVAAVGAPSESAAAEAAELEEPSLAVLGDGSCGYDEDNDQLVVCGAEFLGDFVDTSWLIMPEGQCSAFLDKLFSGQSCSFDDPDCHRFSPAAPIPPSPKLQSSSSPITVVKRNGSESPQPRRAWPPAVSDDVPDSLSSSPPGPPPRGLLA